MTFIAFDITLIHVINILDIVEGEIANLSAASSSYKPNLSLIKTARNSSFMTPSMYNSLDLETIAVVMNDFQGSSHPIHKHMAELQKQDGVCDCGLFIIVIANAEAINNTSLHTSSPMFEQAGMRPHLVL